MATAKAPVARVTRVARVAQVSLFAVRFDVVRFDMAGLQERRSGRPYARSGRLSSLASRMRRHPFE
jgi:hypothetical protein